MNYTNQVTLRGTVVSINTGGQVPTIRLFVKGDRKAGNFPLIYFFDRKMLKGISIQDNVLVIGHTQNRRVQYEGTNKVGSKTVITGDSIMKAERMLCDYFPDEVLKETEGAPAEDINRVLTRGTIGAISPINDDERYVRVRVMTKHGDFDTQCDITCSRRQAEKVKDFKVGDEVCAVSYIFTNIKELPDKTKVHYENVFCIHIEKIS